jgi:hypothetical protein
MGLPEWNVRNIHTRRLREGDPNCQYLFHVYGISICDPSTHNEPRFNRPMAFA